MHTTLYALPLLSAAVAVVSASSSDPKPIVLATRPKLNKARKHHKHVATSGAAISVAQASSNRDRPQPRCVSQSSQRAERRQLSPPRQ